MTRVKVAAFRPSRNCQMRRSGAAPSRSRALRQPKIFQDQSDTREPRAMRAVGAQRRTLYGAVTSAYDSGRDGRSNRTSQLPQHQRPIGPLCPTDSPGNLVRQVRLPKQRDAGRERPQPDTGGATVADLHRGRSRPAYPSTICARTCRTAKGAVRSLGDRSRKFPHFSELLRREHNSLFQSPRKSEPLTSIARGTTSKF